MTSLSEYKAIKIYNGVSIYKVHGSQFYYVRIWDRDKKRYIVKSTRQTSEITARPVAQEYARSVFKAETKIEPEFTFKRFAIKLMSNYSAFAAKGELNTGYYKAIKWSIENPDWGLMKWFGKKDVRKITTRDFRDCMANLTKLRPDLSSSSKNTVMAAFRNVMKVAREDGTIDTVPDTPRARQEDNPRPFFRFYPLVDKDKDVYKKVLETAKRMAQEQLVIRGVPVTDELYDLILFTAHSFVRPIKSELYAIKHSDITIADNPKRLIVVVRKGKTGYRVANTTEGAVAPYQRCLKRNPTANGEDHIFLPNYLRRETVAQIMQRQFRELLNRADIRDDPISGMAHTLYSLRHTAICMRIILSEGQVNIFNLAKNAGTSVDQIERFYARNLPLSKEMAINLQSFGRQGET
jgi:hypothetical protein